MAMAKAFQSRWFIHPSPFPYSCTPRARDRHPEPASSPEQWPPIPPLSSCGMIEKIGPFLDHRLRFLEGLVDLAQFEKRVGKLL